MKTNKILVGIISCLVMFILISPITLSYTTSINEKKIPPLFSFNSYILISLNTTILNEPIDSNCATVVPIVIEYMTDIPDNFLWFLPWRLRNVILYGTSIAPMQKIHLDIENAPEWGLFYILQSDIFTDIPYGNDVTSEQTVLVIYLYQDAPFQPYAMNIRASCESIGRVNGFDTSEYIVFTPEFTPCITIECDNVIEVIPNRTKHIPINITNCGNKKSRVTPSCVECPYYFSPMIYPPFHDIPVGETREFDFIVDIWPDYSDVQTVQLDFKSETFPLQNGRPNITRSLYIVLYYYP